MADMTQKAVSFSNEPTVDAGYLFKMGFLAGALALYVATIGMIEVFSERELIAGVLTLGQVILIAGPLGISIYMARKVGQTTFRGRLLLYGAVVGFISALPLLVIIWLADNTNIRNMFVNLSPGLVEILTFGQSPLILGIIILLILMTLAGVAGAGLRLIPESYRRATVIAILVTLIVGLMSELIILILRPLLGSGFMRLLFSSGGLRPQTALFIFIVSFAISIYWQRRGNTYQNRYQNLSPHRRKRVRGGGYTLLGIILLLLPWIVGTFLSDVLDNVGLYILMGLGLNIAVGLAGLLDLGYVTNFAVGAYVTAILISTGEYGVAQASFWFIVPVSVLAAMFTGFMFALPVLRMRGDYLAIATLGFGEIIRVLALSDWLAPYIGGPQGVLDIPNPPPILPFLAPILDNLPGGAATFLAAFVNGFSRPEHFYYIILAACIVALFVSTRLNRSRTGRQWMALREDEDVAAAMGIDTTVTKLLAFTLSAATGGLAGAIFAVKLGTIFPQSFSLFVSINVLSVIIVGGMGSIPGIVLGAFLLIGAPELLREFQEYRLLLYGALLVTVMLVRPEGLWPSATRRRELKDAMDEGDTTVPHSEVISHGQEFKAPKMD